MSACHIRVYTGSEKPGTGDQQRWEREEHWTMLVFLRGFDELSDMMMSVQKAQDRLIQVVLGAECLSRRPDVSIPEKFTTVFSRE